MGFILQQPPTFISYSSTWYKKKSSEYHTVVEVWTVNSEKNILVTLRNTSKEIYPNKWENSGGSALAGETSKQAAVRELFEETGIVTTEEELHFLATFKEISTFHDIYILHKDVLIEHLTMQPGETTRAKWITLNQLEKMAADKNLAASIGRRFAIIRKDFIKILNNL